MSVDSTIDAPLANEVDRFIGRLGSALGEQWAPATRKWVARAPGRLDVMGGFAEYTGSLTLSYPLAGAVLVALAPRNDQTVFVCALHHEGNGWAGQCSWPLARFYGDGNRLADPQAFAATLAACNCDGAGDIAAVLYALLESKTAPHLGGGLTIGIRSALSGKVGVAAPAATSVAAVLALARALDLPLEPLQCAQLACRGQNLLWGRCQGIADSAAVLLSQPGSLLQLRCQTCEVLGTLPLPEGLALTGIDCGARSPTANRKYIDARVAAFMGRNIIGRILAAEATAGPPWEGHLSQLTVADYVERFRDRLPTRINGADFLARFGESGDPLTTIEPGRVYKVRSRTEHHIYENARAHQFAERLARAARTHEQQAILEAGELMYASHWSYGQRCGLGSIETDRLVTLLRSEGVANGIYGAKISGRGAGGTVVVLHSDTDTARQAIRRAADEYARQSDLDPELLAGTSPGAHAWGVRQIT